MKDKKDLWEGLGIGLMVFFIAIGIGGCNYLEYKGQAELNKSELNKSKLNNDPIVLENVKTNR